MENVIIHSHDRLRLQTTHLYRNSRSMRKPDRQKVGVGMISRFNQGHLENIAKAAGDLRLPSVTQISHHQAIIYNSQIGR